jgi:hypothetical protein
MLNFSTDFKSPLFKPSLKALDPLNRLNAIFVSWYIGSLKSPHLFNWYMSSPVRFNHHLRAH